MLCHAAGSSGQRQRSSPDVFLLPLLSVCLSSSYTPAFFNPLWLEHESFAAALQKLWDAWSQERITHQWHPAMWGQINANGRGMGRVFQLGMGGLLLSVCTLLPRVLVPGPPGQLGDCSWDDRSCSAPSPAAPPPCARCGLALGCRTAALCSHILLAPAFTPVGLIFSGVMLQFLLARATSAGQRQTRGEGREGWMA